MRRAAIVLITFAAVSVQAQVHLIIRSDGTKVISNFGSPASKHGSDWNWWAKQRDRRSGFDAYIDRYATQYRVDPVFVHVGDPEVGREVLSLFVLWLSHLALLRLAHCADG